MASQQGLPPDQRYLETIVHNIRRREDSIGAERTKRQDDIERLARCALPVNENPHEHSPAPQTSHLPQRVSRSGGRIISKLDSGSLTPEASQPAALPSPPPSPIIFKPLIEMASAVPLASTLNSQDIAQLQAALQDHQCQIRSLNLKLEDTQNEVQSLRKERRKASKQHLRAVCGNSEEEIEKHKRKEERLMKMVKEREQIIEGLDKRIEEGREHERELKGKLTEAEGRVEEMKKRPREAESNIRGGGRAGEEDKGNGKDKGIDEKRGGARAGKTD